MSSKNVHIVHNVRFCLYYMFYNRVIFVQFLRCILFIAEFLQTIAYGIGIAILPDFEIRIPQVNFNLIYIPLDTGVYHAILDVIYEDKTENPLPLFLEEV